MEWIDLVQDRNRWRAVVNAEMNLRVPGNAGNFWLAEELLALKKKDPAPQRERESCWDGFLYTSLSHGGSVVPFISHVNSTISLYPELPIYSERWNAFIGRCYHILTIIRTSITNQLLPWRQFNYHKIIFWVPRKSLNLSDGRVWRWSSNKSEPPENSSYQRGPTKPKPKSDTNRTCQFYGRCWK